MLYSVIAAKDGDVYHDQVEAADQEEAEKLAREQLAEAWHMTETLQAALDDEDVFLFDAELDGFAVDPVMQTDAERKLDQVRAILRNDADAYGDLGSMIDAALAVIDQ